MKQLISILLVQFISILSFAQEAKHIVVLGFDGMSAAGIRNSETPVFNKLMKNGAWTLHARAVMPTSSSPNWASMIMGAPPKYHSIHSNRWEIKKIKHRKFCGCEKGKLFPTIFGVMRNQKANANITCYHDWDGFARLTETNAFTLLQDTKDENETADKAIECIKNKHPDFLFLHFDHVDHAGHAIGHFTPEYYKSIAKADSITGAIIKALKEAGIYENTIILITADHGGIKKGHGGRSLAEKEIPWIISGPGIKKGFEITERVETYFTAPTLAKTIGITAPDCWRGRAVLSAFE
jgi:predicted AlkP superfamily pyrophosphatase or phosphodiesterase